MEKVFFKCKERKGRVVDECVFFELDLFRVRARVFRGFSRLQPSITGRKMLVFPLQGS
jgi:hypothetical protein